MNIQLPALLKFVSIALMSVGTLLGPAVAAELSHKDIGDGQGIIFIKGEIRSGDAEKFRTLSIKYKEALVALNSEGGALVPAIEIGKIIKIAGYTTFVPDSSTCTSSCALIWVAGSRRLMSSQGRVGFHASYRDNNGRAEESGLGNALVGSYLTLLNLPQKAIVFATIASPDEIYWLDTANMESSGIEFEIFDIEEQPQAKSSPTGGSAPPTIQTVAVPIPATIGKQSKNGDDWVWYSEGASGTVSYYDANSIRQVGSITKVWTLRDHSNDRTVVERESKVLMAVNCSEISAAVVSFVDYDKNGKVLT
jgi:hypothetical protein